MNETRGLWRGKRVDNGEWVEGFYFETPVGEAYIMTSKQETKFVFKVISETLGECTGLRDKNGKLIFEGDIIREYLINYGNEYDCDCFDCGRVFWHQATSQFLRTSKWFPDDCAPLEEQRIYEVVDNIHDNPELLNDKKEG